MFSTRRSRSKTARLITLGIVTLAGGILVVWLLSAWWLMLFVGIAHRDWWPLIPTMSYHTALVLSLFSTGSIGVAALFGSRNS